MTDWKELFVDENLRDFVAQLIGAKTTDLECVENPFEYVTEWTEMLRGQPHKAVFKLSNKKTVVVKFWCKFNPNFGEPYEEPVELDQEKIIVIVK